MKPQNMLRMAGQNLKRNKKRIFLSSIGVVIGIAVLIFFISLTNGARTIIFDYFLKRLPANQVKITPKYETSMLDFGVGQLMGRGGGAERVTADDRITTATVDKIRALEGVKAVHGLQQVETICYLFPFARPEAAVTSTRAGISCYDTEFIREDIPAGVNWTWKEGDEEVPALLDYSVLAMWNEIFAASFKLPKLDLETVKAVEFYVMVRHNAGGGDRVFRLRVVGASERAPLAAPLVPIEFVRAMNQWVYGSDYQELYSSLVVTADDPSQVKPVLARLQRLGLEASGEQRVAEMIDTGITVITLFFTAISLIIVFISLVNIFNIFVINVMERRFEIGVMRACGAGRGHIRLIILAESFVVGLFNGIVGILLGIGACMLVDPLLSPFVAGFVVGQPTFFAISAELIIAVLIASPVVNMLATFQPANYAARLDPVAALRR